MVTAGPPARGRPRLGPVACVAAAFRGLAFAGLMLAGLGLLLVLVASALLTGLGFGILVVGNGMDLGQRTALALLVMGGGLGIGRFFAPAVLVALRRLANLTQARPAAFRRRQPARARRAGLPGGLSPRITCALAGRIGARACPPR
jgi:hypothetical protein